MTTKQPLIGAFLVEVQARLNLLGPISYDEDEDEAESDHHAQYESTEDPTRDRQGQ